MSRWVKSRYSNADCVEARSIDDAIEVRDSKDPHGPKLRFTRAEWLAFVAGAKDGDFDNLTQQ